MRFFHAALQVPSAPDGHSSRAERFRPWPLLRAVLRSRKGTAPSAARTKAGGQCFGALPNRIVVTIKGDPHTSRGFSWFMNAAPDDLNVELSPSSDFAQITRIPVQTMQVQSRFLERTG